MHKHRLLFALEAVLNQNNFSFYVFQAFHCKLRVPLGNGNVKIPVWLTLRLFGRN